MEDKKEKPKVEWQLPNTDELDNLMMQVFGPGDKYKIVGAIPILLNAITTSEQVRLYLQQFVTLKRAELASNPTGAILAWLAYGFLLGHVWGHQKAPPEPSRIITLH